MKPTKTVLIVDDDDEIRSAMRIVVERAGYRVLTAADGDLGLAVAESERPDLVVVDMMMPKRSGFLVLEKLKGRPGAPKVIMVTGNEGHRHQSYAEILGVDDYLRKPFEMSRLLESISKLCPLEETKPAEQNSPSP